MLWLLVLHVVGNLIWIGSIASVGVVLATARQAQSGGEQAYAIYRVLSVPAFVLSLGAAIVLLAMNPALYFAQTHWMHAKLTVALAVIALHHVLGARAKRLAAGTRSEAGPAGKLTAVLLALAAIAAYLGLAKPF